MSMEDKQPQKVKCENKISLRPPKANMSQKLTASARRNAFKDHSRLSLKTAGSQGH